MSVDCKGYIGYTVTLKENLTHDDFDFFNKFIEEHCEYSQYSEGTDDVRLVTDGMNSEYARLILVDEEINECWIEGKYYFALKGPSVTEDAYNKLNKVYKAMYGKDLVKEMIEYALWFHFS